MPPRKSKRKKSITASAPSPVPSSKKKQKQSSPATIACAKHVLTPTRAKKLKELLIKYKEECERAMGPIEESLSEKRCQQRVAEAQLPSFVPWQPTIEQFGPEEAIDCYSCGEVQADIECEECDECYCFSCERQMHNKEKKNEHHVRIVDGWRFPLRIPIPSE